MVKHIVFFKLKDRSPEHITQVRDKLMTLDGRVPQLRYLEVGIDFIRSERSYDLALVAKFDSREDLQAYQVHPFHVKIANYMASEKESAVAVDYEE